MQNKKLTVGAVVVVALGSLGCDCMWFESVARLQHLFERADVVVVGVPVQPVDPPLEDAAELGSNVLLKVVEGQKGVAAGDTVLLLQDDSNCAYRFRVTDTMVVFGSRIHQVKQRSRTAHSQFSEFNDDRHWFYVGWSNRQYWQYKRLHAVYPALSTSQCITFPRRDSLITVFLRTRKH